MTSKENLTPFEQPPSYEDAIRTETALPPSSLQVATIHQFHNTVPVEQVRQESHVITVQPVSNSDPSVLPIWKVGKAPDIVTCKHCGYNTVPRANVLYTKTTHFWAFVLCLVGFCCCLCCIPYCVKSYKDTTYFCTNCKQIIGTSS
ncbi:hypothetical protein ACFFRR_007810 [Megaselia abdita]